MTAEDVIRQVQADACEWLEMSENPAELLAGILAQKVVQLNDRIQYLEHRLYHDSVVKSRVN